MKVFGCIKNPTEQEVLTTMRICIMGNRKRAKKNLFVIPIADGGKSILLICWKPSPLVEFNQEIFDYYFPTNEDKTKVLNKFSKLVNHQIQLNQGKLLEKDIVSIRKLDKNPFDFFQKEMQKIEGWKPFKEGVDIDQCWEIMLFALKEAQPIKSNKSVLHEIPSIDGSKIIFKHYQTELMFVKDDKPYQFYYLLKPSKSFVIGVKSEFTMNEIANFFRLFRCDTSINQIVEVPLLQVKLCEKCGRPIHAKCTIGNIEFKMHPEINGEDERIFHGFFEDLGEKNRFTIIPTFQTK
ncbi:MAG: hypothetical protein ACPG19_01370 [Saprospiraceae bacterium]